MSADALMARYWLERERRERGEHTGLRAIAPVLSGIASSCHNAPPMVTRAGRDEVCSVCRNECGWKAWAGARAQSGKGDGIRSMVLHPMREIDGDRQDRMRAAEADRFLAFERLAALIEPRPRQMPDVRWQHVLHAYGWALLIGPGLASLRGQSTRPDLGPWGESSVARAVVVGRDVLARRTRRRNPASECRSSSDRASCTNVERVA